MNGKLEEKLARLAFGDLSSQEAAELEREAERSPEVRRVLNEYRAMRSGLRGLSDTVPPDQLSKERLRDAILAQGLKPKAPATMGWTWMWAPVAVAAIAYVAFRLPSMARDTAPVVHLSNDEVPGFNVKLAEPGLSANPLASAPLTSAAVPAGKSPATAAALPKPEVTPAPVSGAMLASNTTRPNRRVRGVARRARAAMNASRTIVIDAGAAANREASAARSATVDPSWMARNASPSPAAMSNPDSTGETSPAPILASSRTSIILIDSHKNAETGTNTATEVGTASNVLVGG